MLLTDFEAQKIFQNEHCNISADLAGILCRAIEAELLEKLKAQEPVAWLITVEKQDGSKETYPAMGRFKDVRASCDFGDPVPLYTNPLPPADVVRVAELEAVLREIRSVAPREVECRNMHHAKKDQHEFDETCPVVSRYAETIAKIDEVLNEDR